MRESNEIIKKALAVRTRYEVVAEELYCITSSDEQQEVNMVIEGLREAARIADEANLVIEELVSMPHFDESIFDTYFAGEVTIDEAINLCINDLTSR